MVTIYRPAYQEFQIDFRAINRASLTFIPALLNRLGIRWRPNGREIQILNPCRIDRHFGSMSICTQTGKWLDFATGECGGDVIGLWAFARGIGQTEAARELSAILGGSNG